MTLIGHPVLRQKISDLLQTNQFPQTALFHGTGGSGKKMIALATAKTLLCATPQKNKSFWEACNQCRSCTLFNANNHPDFFFIEPTTAKNTSSRSLKTEQTASLKQKLNYPPMMGERQVIVIDDAELMTEATANSLLKILEEPRPHQTFILVTRSLHDILITVRSRAAKFFFASLTAAEVAEIVTTLSPTPLPQNNLKFYTQCFPGAPALILQALASDIQIEDLQKLQSNPVSFLEKSELIQRVLQSDLEPDLLLQILRTLTLNLISEQGATTSSTLFLDRIAAAQAQRAQHIQAEFILENLFL